MDVLNNQIQMISEDEYSKALKEQRASQRKAQLAQQLMQGGTNNGTVYDGISAIIRNYYGAKQFKDADQSWADASDKMMRYQKQQDDLAAEQARLQKIADDKAKRKADLADKKALIDYKKSQGVSDAPTVNINNPNESEFMKTLAKKDADTYDKWRSDADAANVIKSKLSDLANLQSKIKTGKWEEAKGILGQYVNVGSLRDDAAIYQAYTGLLKNVVPDVKETFGSLGVMSKDDWKVIMDTLPAFGNDERANEIILAMLNKGADRAISRYQAADDYIMQNQTLRGFSTPAYVNPQNQSKIDSMISSITNMSDDDLLSAL